MGIFQCITIYYIVLQYRYLPHIQVIISNNLYLTSIRYPFQSKKNHHIQKSEIDIFISISATYNPKDSCIRQVLHIEKRHP